MKKHLLILLGALLFTLLFCRPILENLNSWGRHQWDYSFFMTEVARKTVVEYGQIPLWNPYFYGGQPLLAHPHSHFLSPDFLLVLLFGTVVGTKFQILLYFFLGLWGMVLLALELGLKMPSALLPPLVYMGSGFFVLHLSYGHLHFLAMALLPFLFLFFLKSLTNLKYLFPLILTLGLVLLNSGLSLIAITLVIFLFYSLAKSLENEKFTPLLLCLVGVFLAFLLSAIKWIPMLEAYEGSRLPAIQSVKRGDSIPLSALAPIFLNRHQAIYMEKGFSGNLSFGWQEYGLYLGFLPLIFALIGIVSRFREVRWFVFILLATFLLALGNFSPYSPWNMLKALPFVGTPFVVPSRWLLGVLFCLAILSAFGVDWLWRKWGKKQRILLVISLSLIAVDFILVHGGLWKRAFSLPPMVTQGEELPLKQAIMIGLTREKDRYNLRSNAFLFDLFKKNYPSLVQKYHGKIPLSEFRKLYPEFLKKFSISLPYGSSSSMFPAVLSNTAIATGYGFTFVHPKVKWSHRLAREVYSPNQSVSHVEYDFTPNEITLFSQQTAQLLVINQNYSKGWIAKRGHLFPLQSYEGCLSVFVSTNKAEIILQYRPTSFIVGTLISGITFYLLLTFFSWVYIREKVEKDFE